ncbi:alpha/beta hydrolase [Streptomyces sp. ISL-98]|uniref:alpha/beta hydrolase n=1 Tax=Streptomyces sp. ISL-98 TaxID=2819192 RepID=UPI001BE765CF|nr:alpha/beta hydrolase [Streptomyces sp. ISL-98]MBT2510556.1 alpha/beta hydrolase [Streptomyces sp. ISL-98]
MNTHTASGEKSSVVNSVVIGVPAERLWRSCTDIERWPSIFPTTREVRRTEVGAHEVVMDMVVSNELGENTVRSHRRYRPEQLGIDFSMVTLPPAIASMEGSWAIEPAEGGARLVVVHDFVPRDSGAESAAGLAGVLFRTTENVLTMLKEWLEADRDLAMDEAAARDGLRDAWGPRNSGNGVSAETFENCELFFSRLGLAGLDWGDITMVLKDLRKESTHDDWADWHRRWSALGVHYEGREAEALAAGHLETARTANRKAAACHHYAEFFYFDDAEAKWESRDHVTEVFERGIPNLNEVVHRLDITHDGLDVPGYLMLPRGDGPWPCVVLVNGLDSAKEVELYAFAREFIARGMGAVVFDGPGQGVHIGRTPMSVDFERVVGAVMEQVVRRPEVDEDRMGIFGVSFGGYLAARAAATVPGFRACVNLSGGFDHDSYDDVNAMVKKDFRFVFGQADDDAMGELARTSLNLRDIRPLQMPLLAIHGELDTIIPLDACERMLEWAEGKTELILYPGERHVATNYFGDFIPRFCDWMAEQLGVTGR